MVAKRELRRRWHFDFWIRIDSMLNSTFDAIVPMLCVTLAALAAMGAEAFRGKGERMPIGGLGIVGLVGAAVSSALLWNRNAASFGVIVADNFGLFVTIIAGDRRHPDDHVLVAGGRARRASEGRVLRAAAVLHRRHDHDGDGERPAGHLHRPRDPVAGGVRADRHPARQSAGRPRRPSSTSCSARFRARSSSTASRSPTG